MGWNNSDEIVVAGNGQLYVADVGTPLPDDAVVGSQRRLRRTRLHHRGRRNVDGYA